MPWDPFANIARLRDEANRMFEKGSTWPAGEPEDDLVWAPPVDIYETAEEMIVAVELPGMKQEEIEVEITGDTLTIKGERKLDEEKNFVRVERRYGPFRRAFTLGIRIDGEKAKAIYRKGILQVKLPKAEQVKPKRVELEPG